MSLKKIGIVCSLLLTVYLGHVPYADAGNSVTVSRGNNSTYVGWSVMGGYGASARCTPSTNASPAAVSNAWMTYGGATLLGNVALPALTDPLTSAFFSCTHTSGPSDTSYLTVTDCASGRYWNGTSCVLNASPIGSFDSANCSVATGWTCDPDSWSTALEVRFWEGGTLHGVTTANVTREAAVGTACGNGTTAHGFSWTIPDSLKTGTPRTFSAYAINTPSSAVNPELASAKTITCTPLATPTGLAAVRGACGTGSITITWDSVPGATSYTLTDNGVTIVTQAGTSYTHTGLAASSGHAYTVRANSASGNSPDSGVVTQIAPDPCPPVNGVCGPAATSYASGATAYSGALCSAGTASPASPAFPAAGGSSSWTCLGANGGTNSGVCTATRAAAATTNLIPFSLTISAGPYTSGTTMNLTGQVRNSGTSNIGAFSDNFTYQWGGTTGAWLSFAGNTVSKASLNAGITATDGPVSFTPGQAGTLYIQYCTDSSGAITETSPGETDNCRVSAPLTVGSSGCSAQTIANCSLNATSHGGTSGSCSNGYGGTCNYSCSNGTWTTPSTNTCTPPSILNFRVCTDATGVCTTTAGGTHTVPASTPLTFYWGANADTCSAVAGPGFSTGAGSPSTGSDPVTANITPNATDTYTIACQYGTGVAVQRTLYVATAPNAPVLTVSRMTVNTGDSVTVSWDTNNGDETSCSLSGGGLSDTTLDAGGGGTAETGSAAVTIQGRTTFTLTCAALSDVKTVEIIPESWEN